MKLLLIRYASALAIVLVAFSAYALLAVPRMEPPIVTSGNSSHAPRKKETDAVLERQRRKFSHLFPSGSWQLDKPKVLETEHGTLLFKDYKPLDDGRMELKPLTLILYTGKPSPKQPQANVRPMILDAPEGAMLQFDSSTDPARADFGRLVGGLLVGEIKIHSPPTTATANDAIQITTRNVQLDERRIWTPHDVDFHYGPSYGSGRDLVIALLSPEGEGKSRGPSIEGMKSLELVHLDKLHLETAGDALLPGKEKPKTEAAGKQPPPAPVEITCQGPFLCDFVDQVASFEDNVEVLRLNPTGPSDRLTCQMLSIYMQPKRPPDAAAMKLEKPKPGALEVDRVVAVGHPVVLEAPSMGATARGEQMEYHVQTRRIVLDDRDRVMLLDERFDIEAKQLEYRLAENGRVGQLWAAGPGRLRARQVQPTGVKTTGPARFRPPIAPIAARPDPNKPSTMEATWGKELRLRPYKGQHVVSLMENASVGVAQIGGFSADEIHLWLDELPANSKPAANSNLPGGAKLQLEPDRMLATGRVKIRATQLDGETGRLEVWFRKVTPPAAGAAAAGTGAATAPATSPASSPIARQAKPNAAAPPGQKFSLLGDVVRIQLARQGEQTTLDEVSVDGHVKLWDLPPPGGAPQMIITGDALQLRGGMEASAVVRVFGEPASINAQGMTLRGSNVNLHRAENRLWIEGPGDMELPLSSNLGGQKLDKPTNVLVTWERGLEFDGSVARFNSNVEVQTANQLQWARADALDVTMTQKIDFAQAKPGMKPEVSNLAFEGHFALENHSLDKLGKLASIDKMQSENLKIDQQSGRMEAAGPGWVSSVRLGGASSPLTDRGLAAKPVSTQPSNTAPQFNYLVVEFQLQIVGNLFQHQVEFQRHVRAIYGPVASWRDTLNIDQRPEQLNEQTMLMECQRLELREMPGSYANATTMEMEATGDTVVEGKGFTARAARIGYQDEKQLLVLEGDGRQDAELTRQTKIGGPQSSLKSRKIKYWKFDNRVEFDDVRMLELNQLQELKPAKR